MEVLGDVPVVVAQGHTLRKFIPLSAYLQRNSNLEAIQVAVKKTARHNHSGLHTAPGGKTVIRTEAITMNDGRVHGVHVWAGPPTAQPTQRPLPGAVMWNLTTAKASDTPQALLNSGLDLNVEQTHDRPFAADMPIGDINRDESTVLALSMTCKPGDTFCSTWDLTSHDAKPIRVSFVARAALERQPDGTDHLVCRALNWRVPHREVPAPSHHLATQILQATQQEGIHRALVDLRTWNLLKWLDPPCPHIDWRGQVTGQPLVHPDDRPILHSMTLQFTKGPATGLLRLRAAPTEWALIHATVYRVPLLDDNYAGLISIRLPSPAELLRKSRSSRPADSGPAADASLRTHDPEA